MPSRRKRPSAVELHLLELRDLLDEDGDAHGKAPGGRTLTTVSGYGTRGRWMREAVIVDCARSAFGKRKGALAGLASRPTCSASCCDALVERNDFDPARIDDVVGGCVTQSGEQGCNVTRNAWVAAGLPWSVPATSVDRQCGSSQQAAHFVAQGVIAGAYDIAIACGVESMTRAPMSSNARGGVGPVLGRVPREHRTTRSASSSGSRRCSPTSGASRARRWTRSRCSRTERARPRTPTTASSPARSCRCRSRTPRPVQLTGEVLATDEGIRRNASLEALGGAAGRRGSRPTSPRPTSPRATRRR